MPSADVKGLSGSGLSGAREHKERPLTSSQPQMLLSEADTPRCRLLPLWRAVPPRGLGGEYGSRDWSLVGCRGKAPCPAEHTHFGEPTKYSVLYFTSEVSQSTRQIDACVKLPRVLWLLLLSLRGVLNAPFRKRVRADAFPLNQYHSPLGKGTDVNICPLWG
jgi:hypothetical protein